MNFSEYWDSVYSKFNREAKYDNWLDSYKHTFKNCTTKILDLGCGAGNDSLYFIEKGYKVLACDYSKEALKTIERNIEGIETKLLDISEPFEFEDNSFELIIADLCLHYFDEKTTIEIMKELKRILKPNGYLLARVNSIGDVNHGAGQGEKIEENYYFVEGYNKRFFTIKDIKKFFSIIGDVQVKEAEMLRYSKPKKLIEICVKKN